jgi:hypothetical protein
LLLQIRTRVLNGELGDEFRKWCLSFDNQEEGLPLAAYPGFFRSLVLAVRWESINLASVALLMHDIVLFGSVPRESSQRYYSVPTALRRIS